MNCARRGNTRREQVTTASGRPGYEEYARCLGQALKIKQILFAARGFLIRDEVRFGDNKYTLHPVRCPNPPRPGLIEGDPVNRCPDVNAQGRMAELYHASRGRKISPRKICERKPKIAEGGHDPSGVFLRSLHKHINVAGVSRMGMEGKGIPSNDEKSNIVAIERCEELFEVFGYRHTPLPQEAFQTRV